MTQTPGTGDNDSPIVHPMIIDPDDPRHDEVFTRCCGYNWRSLITSGLITSVSRLVTCPGRSGIPTGGPPMAQTPAADSDRVWNAWFIVQHDLCRNTEDAIAREADGRGEAFAAALCSALIEHVAEMQRRYLHLPEKTERE